MSAFKSLPDQNIADAAIDELAIRDVDVTRVRHVLLEGTPDPDLLEYAHENGYAFGISPHGTEKARGTLTCLSLVSICKEKEGSAQS